MSCADGLNIGAFNCKIKIEQPTVTKDAEGGIVETWTDFVAEAWASVDNYSGNEPSIIKHGGAVGAARVLFKMRYIVGVDNTMRIVYNDKYYAIKHISNYKERNQFLYIDCETGKNSGN